MKQITAVGVDVSKGRSMIAVRQPGGVILAAPFKVNHTATELNQLVQMLRQYPGEVRIVMEHTGPYWRPIALALVNGGFFVSVVNAMLIHDFHDNSLRRVKTDKADALKIANYALTFWEELRPYTGEDEIRQLLKTQCRLYERILTSSVSLRNGLISLLDQTFPGINQMFYVMRKETNGHIKWVDFVRTYWHKECVTGLSRVRFAESYARWCKREAYRFNAGHAERIYALAQSAVASLPKNASTKVLIMQAVDSLNAVYDILHKLRNEMLQLAEQLPEFDTVMAMSGVGPITGPKLMGEIGDVRRFTRNEHWLLLRVWTLRHTSLVISSPSPDEYPNEDHRFCAEHCFRSAAFHCSCPIQMILYFFSWIENGQKVSIFSCIWLQVLQSCCVFTTHG